MNPSKDKKSLQFFGKSNYTWMLIGAVCIIIGMFLMSGGKVLIQMFLMQMKSIALEESL